MTKPVDDENVEQSLDRHSEPPVVARFVVEIRSDGRRTIARGAAEDEHGKKVAIQAEGTTPLSLAIALARSMLSLPALAKASMGSTVRALRRKPPRDDD